MRKLWLLFNQYFHHYRKFGTKGIKLVNQINKKGDDIFEVSLKGIPHPFFLRRKTSDLPAFYQVFSFEQYKIDYGVQPGYILDLGANIGMASIYFANKFPKATIIAIEPDESNFQMLTKNTEKYKNIHCLQAGIWNKTTSLKVIDIGKGEWAYMTKEVGYTNGNTINAITIDDVIDKFNLPHVDILKMDVEGAEKEVFECGCHNWIPKVKVMIVELHDRYKEGCSKAFFKTMAQYEFSSRIRGENIICDLK